MRPSHSTPWMLICLLGLLAGCAGTPKGVSRQGADSGAIPAQGAGQGARKGGYYQDDGPGGNPPANLDQIPDAVPRVEPYANGANRPYVVFGQQYTPDTSDRPFRQRGVGSWYGRKFHGQKTSSGELYDMYGMTAAHPTLPIPSYARVTNLANGKSIVVRVNDRGPFLSNRVIDLSYAGAYRLGYLGQGSGQVEVERLLPRDIAAGRIPAAPLVASAAAPVVRTPPPARAAPAPVVAVAAVPAQTARTAPVEERTAPAGVSAAPDPGDPIAAIAALPMAPLPPADVLAPTVSSPSGWYLQLGAFRNLAGADEFRVKIAARMETGAEQLRVVQGGEVYRVQLGPYTERSGADSAAERVRATLEVSPFVVTPR